MNKYSNTPLKNQHIDEILKNCIFNEMYTEPLNNHESIFIIPLKNEYANQHTGSHHNQPLKYLILVKNSNENFRRADVMLFFANDSKLTKLPKNSFYNFFNNKQISSDGTFTMLTLGCVKQFEMDFKSGSKFEFRVWHGKINQSHRNPGEIYCTSWYLVTTYYYADGHTEVDWEYLGDTCSTCAPNELCDELEGGAGSAGGEEGTHNVKNVTLLVKRELTPYEDWKIDGVFKLTGVSFTNSANNFFTDISNLSTACIYFHAVTGGWELSPHYSEFHEVSHSSGLNGNNTAWGNIHAIMVYPNYDVPQGQPTYTRSFFESQSWSASLELF